MLPTLSFHPLPPEMFCEFKNVSNSFSAIAPNTPRCTSPLYFTLTKQTPVAFRPPISAPAASFFSSTHCMRVTWAIKSCFRWAWLLYSCKPYIIIISDCNPGIKFSIPESRIEKFVIHGSRDPVSGFGLQNNHCFGIHSRLILCMMM